MIKCTVIDSTVPWYKTNYNEVKMVEITLQYHDIMEHVIQWEVSVTWTYNHVVTYLNKETSGNMGKIGP